MIFLCVFNKSWIINEFEKYIYIHTFLYAILLSNNRTPTHPFIFIYSIIPFVLYSIYTCLFSPLIFNPLKATVWQSKACLLKLLIFYQKAYFSFLLYIYSISSININMYVTFSTEECPFGIFLSYSLRLMNKKKSQIYKFTQLGRTSRDTRLRPFYSHPT